MAVGLDKVTMRDFSAGMFRGVREDLIPENGAYDITNGLLDNTGNIYRRGGSSYRNTSNFGSVIPFVWDGWLTAGQRTLIASTSAFGILNGDGSVTSLAGGGVAAPLRVTTIGGKLYIPGGQTFDGTSLGSAAMTGAYYAVASNRLLAAQGSQVNFSNIYAGGGVDPSFDPLNFHLVPEGVQITGLQALRNAVAVFTTGGIWIISNLGYDLTDADGNIQQRVDKYSSDLVLWGDAGIAAYEGGLVMPAADGVWLLSLGVESEARVPFARISDPIQRLYREYVTAGYTPGQACVFNGHYFLPVLSGLTPVDLLVCRLDSPARPWSHFEGFGAELAAMTVRTSVSGPRAPQLIGGSAKAGRVLDLDYFQTVTATGDDADGSPHPYSVQLRDYPTGPLNKNTVMSLEMGYELAGDGAAITATWLSGKQGVGGTLWGEFNWGGANWNVDPVTAPLSGQAPENPFGLEVYKWRVGERERFARVRLDCTAAASYLTLRYLILRIRSSGRN